MMAIEKGNFDAMSNMGVYYKYGEKNYDEMKKYYIMAIEKGNSDAMFNLGYYYENTEINYDKMKKYYLMAIKQGYSTTNKNLANYLNENISKLYKDFETYCPFLDKLDISDEHKTNIRNKFLANNKVKIKDLPLPDDLKHVLLFY